MKRSNNLLEDEYDRCIRNIVQSSERITNMALEGD